MTSETNRLSLSVMLIVSDAAAAVDWYETALGAAVLWDLGGVAGLHLCGAPFFVHEAVPGKASEPSPTDVGLTTTRIEVFVDEPGRLSIALPKLARRLSSLPRIMRRLGEHIARVASRIRSGIAGLSEIGRRWSSSRDRSRASLSRPLRQSRRFDSTLGITRRRAAGFPTWVTPFVVEHSSAAAPRC
jgi:catechol 2,3-dioxygenase-like lactoylglutathione lyase family enzyme